MAESLFIKVDEVGELLGISRAEAYRIIKKLNSELAEKGYIVISGRVSRRYLEEQIYGIETIDSEQATPSLSQAQRMKCLSQEGKLNDDAMLGIMMEQKKPETWDLMLPMDKIRKFFPCSYTPQRMEETIIKLLEMWMKKRQRDQQR